MTNDQIQKWKKAAEDAQITDYPDEALDELIQIVPALCKAVENRDKALEEARAHIKIRNKQLQEIAAHLDEMGHSFAGDDLSKIIIAGTKTLARIAKIVEGEDNG